MLAWGLLAGALPRVASAHDSPYSALALERHPGGVAIRVTLHPVDAASVLGSIEPDSLLDSLRFQREAPGLAVALGRRSSLTADGVRLVPELRGSSVKADRSVTLEMFAPWAGVPGRLEVHARFVPEDPEHETFLEVREGGRVVRQEVLTARRTTVEVFGSGGSGLAAVAAVFVPSGIHHIFTGPDHVLFVIGLLLLGGSVLHLLKIVTAFTLAHSITLALAALGIVEISPQLIEPLIALSIVLVGVENLRAVARPRAAAGDPFGDPAGTEPRPRRDRRTLLAFSFGLIHGFGFAGVLRETGLPREALAASLLTFNAGVELGQACIVLAVVPLLALLRSRAPRLAPALAATGSWVVIAAGGFWLVQRVLARG